MKTGRLAAIAAILLIAAGAPAQAATILAANLTGTQEVPPNSSPATGRAVAMLDGTTLTLNLNFSGLVGGGVTGAHIHCCAPPGVNAPVRINFENSNLMAFPFGQTSGTYNDVFDLTADLVGISLADFTAGFEAGRSYVNLHNAQFPGGEIRGQLVPEPTTWGMLGGGLLALWAGRRRIARA